MVFVVANGSDKSTIKVLDYLRYNNIYYCHYCPSSHLTEIKRIELDSFAIIHNGNIIDSDEITSYWYRNSQIHIENNIVNELYSDNLIDSIKEFGKSEINAIITYIHILLENKKKIGSFFKNQLNKLFVLRQAQLCGFLVPTSLVTTSAESIEYYLKGKKCLTKSMSKFYTHGDQIILNAYSSIIDNNIASSFFPSYVQEYIEKDYEIRSFFFNNEFYSMAIFSQSNKDTQVDYRINSSIKNRNVPYKLPKHIADKSLHLMSILGLDTGSIDFIKAVNGDFIFLEINPNGIFENVSYYCNYYLEKKIADYLSKI